MSTSRTGSKLTDAKLRSIQPGSPVLTHSGVSGLMIKPGSVTRGTETWYIRFYDPADKGKRIKLKIGNYPAMSLSEAETEAKRLFGYVDCGEDPRRILANDKLQVKVRLTNTFANLMREFYQRELSSGKWKNQRYTEQWLREMENHVIPSIGSIPMTDIKAPDIVRALSPVWHKTPDTAAKLLDRIRQVFTYSEAMGFCEHNPCPAAKIALGTQKRKPKSERRMPAMPWQDVPRFIADILLSGRQGQAKRALIFLILNAARSGAVRHLAFSEIDFEKAVWTMQADAVERKTGIDRYYPLSAQSITLLKEQFERSSTDLVFPASKPNKKGLSVLSDMTLTNILRKNAQDFKSDIDGRIPTAHGFRTAFKGWAVANGYDDKWSEIQLAHEVGNAVQQAYDREQLIEQRRGMMQAWADFVMYPSDSKKLKMDPAPQIYG